MWIEDKEILDEIGKLTQGADKVREERKSYYKGLWKRFRAKNSVFSDASGKKTKPWKGCSNIGYLIEQIVIEALVPRYSKVQIGNQPVVQVIKLMGGDINDPMVLVNKYIKELKQDFEVSDPKVLIDMAMRVKKDTSFRKQIQNKLISKYTEDSEKISNMLNYQAFEEEWGWNMPEVTEIADRFTLVEGGCIEKVLWDKQSIKTYDKIKTITLNGEFQLFKRDENKEIVKDMKGNPVPLDIGDKSIQDIYSMFSEEQQKEMNVDKMKVVDHYIKIETTTKDRAKVIPKSLSDYNIPDIELLTDSDPNEWPWIEDLYSLSLCDIINNQGEQFDGFKLNYKESAIDVLKSRHIDTKDGGKQTVNLNKKIDIKEFHGKIDVDGDGELEDVEVHYVEDILLGWRFCRYSRRPFFNRIAIPQVEYFHRGISVIEVIWSIRNWLDKIINMLNDHASITISPPILFGKGHGADLKECKWGLGKKWPVDDPSMVREMQISKSDLNANNVMQVLLGIVQKLFGVTDYTLGSESEVVSNKTATGIVSLIQEGNIKFDHMISRLQRVNKQMFQFIHKLNILFLDKDIEFMMSSGDMPYQYINRSILAGDFEFNMTGNSINTNERVKQQTASFLFNLYAPLYMNGYAFVSDEKMKKITEDLDKAFGLKIKTPTLEEVQAKKVEIQKRALRANELQKAGQQIEKAEKTGKMQPNEAMQAMQQLQKDYADVLGMGGKAA